MDNTTSTLAHLPGYRYRPLEGKKWIRVIRLYPSSTLHDHLVCRIIHMDREWLMASADPDLNYYSAVSYAWGEPNFCKHLYCEAESGERSAIPITSTVDSMLRRVRKHHEVLNLWIDAICLNQKDRVEIQEQLPEMGTIYKGSQTTRAWLGDDDHGIAGVFAMLRVVWYRCQTDGIDSLNEAAIEDALRETVGLDRVQAFDGFFGKTWFTRRWILQELILSRDVIVYCSGARISWAALSGGLQTIEALNKIDRHVCNLNAEAQRVIQLCHTAKTGTRSLLDALWNHHTSECSDPRDKIMAVLGFSEPLDWISDVQYDQTSTDLFMDFAKRFVSAGHLAQILNHAIAFGAMSAVDESAPSWCPDWTARRSADRLSEWTSADLATFALQDHKLNASNLLNTNPGKDANAKPPIVSHLRPLVSSRISENGRCIYTIQRAVVVANTAERETDASRLCPHNSLIISEINHLSFLRKWLFRHCSSFICPIPFTAPEAPEFPTTVFAELLVHHITQTTAWKPRDTVDHQSEITRQITLLLHQSTRSEYDMTDPDMRTIVEGGLLEALQKLFQTNSFFVSHPVKVCQSKGVYARGSIIGLGPRSCTRGDFMMLSNHTIPEFERPFIEDTSTVYTNPKTAYLFRPHVNYHPKQSQARLAAQVEEEMFLEANVHPSIDVGIRDGVLRGRCTALCTVMAVLKINDFPMTMPDRVFAWMGAAVRRVFGAFEDFEAIHSKIVIV